MIVISRNLVLSPTDQPGPDNTVFGYQNVVTTTNIVADQAASGYPASNLANPATFLKWKGTSAALQYVTITTGTADPLDYVGIAGHNFGTAQIAASIEGFIGGVWTELVQPVLLPDDAPAIFRFVAQAAPQVRIKLAAGLAAPSAAVVYVGKLLVMERGLYDNHTPLKYARRLDVTNGRSESGEFLGRIVTGEDVRGGAAFQLLSPSWYRANMEPFLLAAKEEPFFMAWRPQTYPREAGYAWLTSDPMPVNTPPSKLIAIELQMAGVAP